jgi:hypothetical protein
MPAKNYSSQATDNTHRIGPSVARNMDLSNARWSGTGTREILSTA